jgi:hypothetical protein
MNVRVSSERVASPWRDGDGVFLDIRWDGMAAWWMTVVLKLFQSKRLNMVPRGKAHSHRENKVNLCRPQ